MTTFLLTLLVLLALTGAMSIGVLMGRKPISGSCGGMSAVGMKSECDLCGGKPEDCDKANRSSVEQQSTDRSLAYNAAENAAERRHT